MKALTARSHRIGVVALLLSLAAAAPVHERPPPRSSAVPGRPAGKAAPNAARHASNEAIADQFLGLAYGADPASGVPARAVPARFAGEMHVFLSGSDADRRVVEAAAAALPGLTGVPMDLVQGGQPTVVVVVGGAVEATFRGPLRALLTLALDGGEPAADAFLSTVVAVQPCWIVPVWTDPSHTLVKAAVIGVDGRLPRSDVERCILRRLAGAAGLLGADDALPRSVFNPAGAAVRLSFEDRAMIRLLYALPAGLGAGQARAAALDLLPGLRAR